MALTATFDSRSKGMFYSGAEKVRRGTLLFDSSYSTGGKPVTAATFNLRRLDHLDISPSGGLIFEFDKTNMKVKAYYPTGGATAAPTSASAVPQVTGGASSATAVNATTPALTPGVAKEVGNTADLSTITPRFEARGL
jgi:hypothetical protein